MGNCLPFLGLHHYFNHDDEEGDLTRLNSIQSSANSGAASGGDGRSQTSSSRRRRSGGGGQSSAGSSSGVAQAVSRSGAHRHLHASSYVNELYVSALRGGGERGGSSAKLSGTAEEKKARVRGLLTQLPVDAYVQQGSGKGCDEVECAICMVDFVAGDPIRYLPCMHCYHLTCIDDWLLRSFTCPSCMEPVDSAILSSFNVNAVTDLGQLSCSPANTGSTSTK